MQNRRIAVSAIAVLASVLFSDVFVTPARAIFVVDITQSGSNVIANGSGTIDTAALTEFSSFDLNAGMNSGAALLRLSSLFDNIALWQGITGPTSFGTYNGDFESATSSSGDFVGLSGEESLPSIQLSNSYVSGSELSDTATWAGATYASLGLAPGNYTWTWGSGETADSFEVSIAAPVPEPASLGLICLGASLLLCRHKSLARRSIA
jgi:PEP-CTERM motif